MFPRFQRAASDCLLLLLLLLLILPRIKAPNDDYFTREHVLGIRQHVSLCPSSEAHEIPLCAIYKAPKFMFWQVRRWGAHSRPTWMTDTQPIHPLPPTTVTWPDGHPRKQPQSNLLEDAGRMNEGKRPQTGSWNSFTKHDTRGGCKCFATTTMTLSISSGWSDPPGQRERQRVTVS